MRVNKFPNNFFLLVYLRPRSMEHNIDFYVNAEIDYSVRQKKK